MATLFLLIILMSLIIMVFVAIKKKQSNYHFDISKLHFIYYTSSPHPKIKNGRFKATKVCIATSNSKTQHYINCNDNIMTTYFIKKFGTHFSPRPSTGLSIIKLMLYYCYLKSSFCSFITTTDFS